MHALWNGRQAAAVLGIIGCLSLLALPVQQIHAGDAVGPAAKGYQKVSGVDGNLNSIGSDTLNNLMTYWAEAFGKMYPNVRIQVEGKGSATAPPALIAGMAQLGPMSRTMKPEEEDAFEQKHGFRPLRISVALDCLAVYVHKDNPIHGLTLTQVDCIFSKTCKSGFREISTWGDAGLSDAWATLPISLYGRNSASGTYAYFKEHAPLKGDYKDTVKEQPGSAAVVNGVAADRAGIGYSGIGYRTSEVRAIPLAKDDKAPLTEPTFANALRAPIRSAARCTFTWPRSPANRCRSWWRSFCGSCLLARARKSSSRTAMVRCLRRSFNSSSPC